MNKTHSTNLQPWELRIAQALVHAAYVCVWQVAARKTCIEIELLLGILVTMRFQTSTWVRCCVVEFIFVVSLVDLEFFVCQNSNIHVVVLVLQVSIGLLSFKLILLEFELSHSRLVIIRHLQPGVIKQCLGTCSVRRIPLQDLHQKVCQLISLLLLKQVLVSEEFLQREMT